MAGKLQYTPTDTYPFIPMDVAKKRLVEKSRLDGDCRVWFGAMRRNPNRRERAGYLRIWGPTGFNLVIAHRLAWWCEYKKFPSEDDYLKRTCGNSLCITVSHLEPINIKESRMLSSEQVIEARKLFWRPYMKLTKKELKMKPMTAERLAAWSLKMSETTIARVMQGQPVWPRIWRGHARTEAQVKAAVSAHQGAAERYRREREAASSVTELAARYRVQVSVMLGVVHGTLYGDIPMPEEARIRLQKQGQARFREEVFPPTPRITEDGSFDYSRPSDSSVRLHDLKKKAPARQRLEGAMDYVMS